MKDRMTSEELLASLHRPKRKHIQSTPTTVDGFRFDSQLEARRYEWLKADPTVVWLDIHPVVTLSTGRRWKLDFMVYPREGAPWLEDVTGATRGEAWRRKTLKAEDVRAHHPIELRLIVWDRAAKEWKEV